MHTDRSEQDLLQGMLQRDTQALEALVWQYDGDVSRFIASILYNSGTAQDIEDCKNDVYTYVWQNIETYDPADTSLRTWITLQTKYIALERRRKNRSH